MMYFFDTPNFVQKTPKKDYHPFLSDPPHPPKLIFFQTPPMSNILTHPAISNGTALKQMP